MQREREREARDSANSRVGREEDRRRHGNDEERRRTAAINSGLDSENKALRDRIRGLEENLDDERSDRRAVEDQLSRQQADSDDKLREVCD